jgi:hypothetical protein
VKWINFSDAMPRGFISNGVIKHPSSEDEFRSSIEVYDL